MGKRTVTQIVGPKMSIVLPNAADIPAFAGIPDDVAAKKVPIASAVACDSAVANLIAALTFLGSQLLSWFLLASLLLLLLLLLLTSLESLL
jgi:hypothetical protein